MSERRRRPILAAVLALGLVLAFVPSGAAVVASGDLDPTFGSGGKVTTAFASFSFARDMAVQADGKIVVVGQTDGGRHARFALARYERDGDLDRSFGGNGKVTTRFGADGASADGVAIATEGRIVVVGASAGRFAVARYEPDGSLDGSFGGDGKVRTRFGPGEAGARDAAIAADGKIVVVGETVSASCCPATLWFAVARYGPDGTLDTTFGDDGKVTTAFEGFGQAFASGVAVQPDGTIVVAGTASCEVSCSRFALARYLPDGTLDATFGVGGTVTTDLTGGFDMANAVAIAADGTIVAAGEAGSCCELTGSFGLVRYTTDGTPDASFDGDGMVITNFTRNDDAAADVALAADGRIVVAGTAGHDGLSSAFALARYDPDGALDAGFGGNGKVKTRFGPGPSGIGGVAISANGRIVVAGRAFDYPATRFALARYRG